jgi:hypothetical protein
MDSLYVLHINKLEYSIIPSQISMSRRIEKVKLVGEHDRVLALFPSGREARYTTHRLSQDLDQRGRLAKGLSETPRKNRQARDVYGSNDRHDYGFGCGSNAHGSDYGDSSESDSLEGDDNDNPTEDSSSESNISEENYTEDDLSESNPSEYDQVTSP